MKKRELRRSIFQLIGNREAYGYELRSLLAARGEKVQLSYLYKTIKGMVEDGLLESRNQRGERGPPRKMYRLTRLGKKELGQVFAEATELIHDFYERYVSELPPQLFSNRFQAMFQEVYGGKEAMALVISEPLTQLHRGIARAICTTPGIRRAYLIKPSDTKVEIEYPNLTVMNGSFDDIPLKDGSLDGMVVVDIQDAFNIRSCCREFRRVMKNEGTVCACAPFVRSSDVNNPLDLGEFMKKMKYDLAGIPYLERETIKLALAESFDNVKVASVGFLTAFIASPKMARKPLGSPN